VVAEHYAGDDTNVRTLLGGVLAAHSGISVDDFEEQADSFLRTAQHPTLGRGYLQCAYAPMVELLAHLEANGFSNYIASIVTTLEWQREAASPIASPSPAAFSP
jgi:hypothetical protein